MRLARGLIAPLILCAVASAVTSAVTSTVIAVEPTVDLELVTEPGFPLDGSQRWLAALKDLEVNSLRIRTGRAGDRAAVNQRGTDAAPRYHVIGILTAGNKLALPGGTFTINDRGGIKRWLEKLKDGGEEGVTTRPAAFGLTGKQLVAVSQALSAPVPFSTKGMPPLEVAREVAKLIPLKFTVDPQAKQALADGPSVADELQGLSAGTVMAAAIRPLGLVLVPFKPRGQEPRLLVTDVRKSEQSWPVGWPSERSPGKTLPKLFDFLTIEIQDIPLSEALEALGERLQAPMLMDHNALARHDIDPTSFKVSLPQGRSFYKKILDRLLRQAKLKVDLRIDEMGKPFMWITTIQ